MCLGIPMRIECVDADGTGEVELDGTRHTVSLELVSGPGCPVCMTETGYLDTAVELARGGAG